jgi:hypothetical protein
MQRMYLARLLPQYTTSPNKPLSTTDRPLRPNDLLTLYLTPLLP